MLLAATLYTSGPISLNADLIRGMKQNNQKSKIFGAWPIQRQLLRRYLLLALRPNNDLWQGSMGTG
jgi:hypothetical protein